MEEQREKKHSNDYEDKFYFPGRKSVKVIVKPRV